MESEKQELEYAEFETEILHSIEAPEALLRRIEFNPYLPGHGPIFTLTTWDCGDRTSCGKYRLGYRLSMCEDGKTRMVFEGAEFGCSPCHAIDSDEACAAIMGFLTLRPGDTDSEYFENYTQFQLDYCEQHAEALGYDALCTFGEEF